MFSKLIMKLDIDNNNIVYNSSSIFQGFLMETINRAYAEKLHDLSYNPYSQFIYKNKEGTFWIVTSLNTDAHDNIINPLLEIEKVNLKNKNLEINISNKNLEIIKRENLIGSYLFEDNPQRRFNFNFKTPTAFKSQGKYVIIPNSRLIFQNLMKKFDSSGKEQIYSNELMDSISNHSYISKYSLKSCLFNIESVTIPSFLGRVEIKLETNKEIARICNLLCKFSEFSGVGIKCSMGMGAVINGVDKIG